MLIFVVKKGVWFEEELHLDDPTVDIDIQRHGMARLWYEETGAPSDYFLVVSDNPPQNYGEPVKGMDRKLIMDGLDAVFQRARVNMEEYGEAAAVLLPDGSRSVRSFHCDFALPIAVIDGYTG